MGILTLSPFEIEAIKLSLKVSLWAVFVSLPIGILVSWILARHEFVGKVLFDGLIHLPLVVPPVVTGYILLLTFGSRGFLGILLNKVGINFAFNWKGAAIASAIMAFPLMVRSIRLSIESVDRGLEDASRTLGIGPFRTFFSITLPLITPGIITGIMLAFARSLGEFGATITFVSNIPTETRTIPLALYTLTQMTDGGMEAIRLCLLAILISLLALIASDRVSKKLAKRING